MGGPQVRVFLNHQLVRELRLAGPMSIGRLPDNDIVIEDELVSGHHARIEQVEGTWRYVDLGSTNGSIVAAGPTLRDGEVYDITDDAQILLGATVIDVRFDDDVTSIRRAGVVGDASSEPGAAPPLPARVLVPGVGSIALRGRRAVLGRNAGCDVVVEDASVSAKHAELAWDGRDWVLRDLASTNGTRVGMQRVRRSRPVAGNTHIILGDADLLLVVEDGKGPADDDALGVLASNQQLQTAQVRQAREALAAGEGQLGEILVGRGWLSPGQWSEAVAEANSGIGPRPPARRGPLIALAVILVLLLAWLLISQLGN